MPLNWNAFQKALIPIKSYADLCRRWQESFSYPFVCTAFNLSMPQVVTYTRLGIGSDPKNRYTAYAALLERIFSALVEAGVRDVVDLMSRVDSREKLEAFIARSGIEAVEIAEVLKYLVYWVIPNKKLLSGLVNDDPQTIEAVKVLRETGVRSNLDLLQVGITPAGCKTLAGRTGLPESRILELVNRADLSRMPWASKRTISNITGAGYGSLAALRSADPKKLVEDFYRYGESIGKNLRLGNEIENSYRFAQIVPLLVE